MTEGKYIDEGLNKRHSISPNNPNYEEIKAWAENEVEMSGIQIGR
jgi:hypothetical protein